MQNRYREKKNYRIEIRVVLIRFSLSCSVPENEKKGFDLDDL